MNDIKGNLPLYLERKPRRISEFRGIDYLHCDIEYLLHTKQYKVLVTGLYGWGKTSLAEAIVYAENCVNRRGMDACLECDPCANLLEFPWWSDCAYTTGSQLDSPFMKDLEMRWTFVARLSQSSLVVRRYSMDEL